MITTAAIAERRFFLSPKRFEKNSGIVTLSLTILISCVILETTYEIGIVEKGIEIMAMELTSKNFTEEVLNSNVPVMVDFWATWCGPCVREMPAFERLAEEYKDEVVVIAVNCMEDENTVSDFIKDNGYTFPVAFDVKGEICEKYPSDGIPYTLVIDKEGVIRKIYLGAGDAEEQYEEYKKAIEDVLGE